jgi:tetratricopeptide (TPR) repeat protein
MRKLFLILSLVFIGNILLASNTLFEKANKFYAEHKYEDAIALYDSIQQKGLQSTALFYNLGNAHYKLQSWAQSILYFEKTLKINANHEDALHNLALTQLKIVDKIEAIPLLFFQKWINSIIAFFPIDSWAVFCIIFLWLGVVFFAIRKLTDLQLPKHLFAILIICSALTFVFSNRQHTQKTQQKTAITFSSSVVIKSAPSFSANDIFSLHAGSKIRITDQIGEWIHIQLSNGNKGWMLKENCREI